MVDYLSLNDLKHPFNFNFNFICKGQSDVDSYICD